MSSTASGSLLSLLCLTMRSSRLMRKTEQAPIAGLDELIRSAVSLLRWNSEQGIVCASWCLSFPSRDASPRKSHNPALGTRAAQVPVPASYRVPTMSFGASSPESARCCAGVMRNPAWTRSSAFISRCRSRRTIAHVFVPLSRRADAGAVPSDVRRRGSDAGGRSDARQLDSCAARVPRGSHGVAAIRVSGAMRGATYGEARVRSQCARRLPCHPPPPCPSSAGSILQPTPARRSTPPAAAPGT